jgi:hypothetical protein
MRAILVAVLIVALQTGSVAAADESDLARSGQRRLATGIALIAIGVLGWGVSTAGTILSIVGYVKDARNECGNGACDTIQTTGRWLGIGGSIAEVGGLAGGIPLVISGVHRLREARRMRLGVALSPTGGVVLVGGSL